MKDTIKTLSEYVKEVSILSSRFGLTNSTTTPWFRGQAESNWDLIPSIHRTKGLIGYERDLTRDFKLLSHRILQSEKPENEFDWLYLMQHYELPTRLLDWTESALIALFFCVRNLIMIKMES